MEIKVLKAKCPCCNNDVEVHVNMMDEKHFCSTCKHRLSNVKENPCFGCNVRMLKDNWEADDE